MRTWFDKSHRRKGTRLDMRARTYSLAHPPTCSTRKHRISLPSHTYSITRSPPNSLARARPHVTPVPSLPHTPHRSLTRPPARPLARAHSHLTLTLSVSHTRSPWTSEHTCAHTLIRSNPIYSLAHLRACTPNAHPHAYHTRAQSMDELADINEGENTLMKIWNRFIWKNRHVVERRWDSAHQAPALCLSRATQSVVVLTLSEKLDIRRTHTHAHPHPPTHTHTHTHTHTPTPPFRNKVLGQGQMGSVCWEFVKQCGDELKGRGVRNNLFLHLANLKDYRLLEPATVASIMHHYDTKVFPQHQHQQQTISA